MEKRTVGILALATLVTTFLWLVTLVWMLATAGPLKSYQQVLAYTASSPVAFKINYFLATMVTLCAILFFYALSADARKSHPQMALFGRAFIPIYGALNLVIYAWQFLGLPKLVDLLASPEDRLAAGLLVRLSIHLWPGSAAALYNSLAYALLAIPSIIFGYYLLSQGKALRSGGILLALNGLACLLGLIGTSLSWSWLAQGTLVGGVLFFFALVPITRQYLGLNPSTA